MNVEKALKILGLQHPTTLEEVEERFQQLAKENHPDKGGDNEKMQELNVARDVVRVSFNNQALTAISVVTDLIKKNAEIARKQEIREDLSDLTKVIKQIPQNQLIIFRNLSIIVTAIAAGLIFFGKDVLPKDFQYSVLFTIIGAVALFAAGVVNEKVRRYGVQIDELKKFLSQKKRFLELISEILPEWKNSKWSFNDLEDAVYDWIRSKAKSNIVEKKVRDTDDMNQPTLKQLVNKHPLSSEDIMNIRRKIIKLFLSEWEEAMNFYLKILKMILTFPFKLLGYSSKSERDWKRIAKIIGSEDFSNLILLKAKELKILDEEIIDADSIIEYYSINLKQKSE